ncbi:alpha/beta fold hydrolase [Streptomyces sp. NPDC020490]|uniref:alpha/beta fold hydrolase n=1 Tax=Streptomyces sp. NPDC020490 TaxID=3365078 RepID=UPI00378894C9
MGELEDAGAEFAGDDVGVAAVRPVVRAASGRGARQSHRHGSRAAAEFVAGAFSARAPPGLRTAHVRTMLGTPGHVIAQAYAGMYTDPGAVGIRPYSEAYLRRRPQPALTVWTSAEAAVWERTTLHVTGSRVEHWPGVGHYLHEEQPGRTVRLIEAWAAAPGALGLGQPGQERTST